MTLQEALDYCGKSRSCLRRWEAEGRLKRIPRQDGKIRYRKASLDKLLLSPLRRGRKAKK